MQHIVLAPSHRVFAGLQQQGMLAGEAAPEEALRPHVIEWIRQTVKPSVGHIVRKRPLESGLQQQGRAMRIDRVEQGDLGAPALLVDAEQLDCGIAAAHFPACRVGGAARIAANDDTVRLRLHGPHHGGPAHAHAQLQFACAHAASGSQDGQ
jgi:hypothetical protein